ncbi:MAG: polysaccharide biosynthesis/export family protein [Crocinitomicaceae bacterium]|nr:polysaccharide biosynthesis/export family protein [Crocinitomicaceae bacterium]
MNSKQIIFGVLLMLTSSCGVYNSNKLLAPSKDPSYTISSYEGQTADERIRSGDELRIKIYPNSGEQALLSIAALGEEEGPAVQGDGFVVNSSGEITLPLLGSISVQGLRLEELEAQLTEKLATIIQAPYVEITIVNKRVLLFNGKGAGQVIPLKNEGTTLMETLAIGGGVKDFGKSNEIKLFRQENGQRKIYEFDLSEMNQLKNTDVIIKNRDIIVINHNPRNVQNTLREIGPWLSILTSGLAIFSIFSKL